MNSHNFFNNQGAVWNTIQEPANVCVQHPVHLLPLDPDHQRIQRLMLAASRPGALRESPKVLLINLAENSDYGLLNDLVLQGRNAQRPLATVGFRNVYSPRWLRSVSAAMHPAVQI